MAAGTAVPDLPLPVALAIGVGGWSQRPAVRAADVQRGHSCTSWFRAVTLASFVAVSAGWAALAVIAVVRL